MQEGRKYKQVPKFPDYWVGDNGIVISMKSGKSERIGLKTGKVALSSGNRIKRYPIHYLVWIMFKGRKPKNGLQCRHLDCNVSNNALSNLAWGTPEENEEYRLAYHNKPHVFTMEDIRLIRHAILNNFNTIERMAYLYKVEPNVIADMVDQ